MTATATTPASLARLRRRTLALLAAGQILGGLGTGAALSVGALVAAAAYWASAGVAAFLR